MLEFEEAKDLWYQTYLVLLFIHKKYLYLEHLKPRIVDEHGIFLQPMTGT